MFLYDLEKKGSEIIHHKPKKPPAHLTLEHVQRRKTLSPDEIMQLEAAQKGFKGELKFYQLVTEVNTTGKFLFDLLFSSQGTEFQIDSLHIHHNTLTMYEIKHFSGDFFMNQDKWYLASNKQEIRNPLIQLQRSEFLLRELLKPKHPNLNIQAYLVFVHESFMLYQVPLGYPAIFPAQLKRFQQSIKTNRTIVSQQTENIATTLSSLHIGESKYAKYPTYTHDELQKGIICSLDCSGFLHYSKRKLQCSTCEQTKSLKNALNETIAEFHFLFPKRKITTGSIYEWCNGIVSKKSIQNYLSTYFTMIKNGKHTYYLPSDTSDVK